MDNKNLPAFPIVMQPGTPDQESYPGMTKKEWFTGMALMGLCQDWSQQNSRIAEEAIRLADTVLAKLEIQPAPDK